MPSVTIRLMSANGKGFSNAAFTMLNSPVAAAIPTARETIAVSEKPGLRNSERAACLTYSATSSARGIVRRSINVVDGAFVQTQSVVANLLEAKCSTVLLSDHH